MHKAFAIALSLSILLTSASLAQAQASGGGTTVPIGTNQDSQSIFHYNKDSFLDKAAYTAAKGMLKQLTASTVQWINSGFQGSPGFLTNPEGFFLDIGDQVTGAFIGDYGPLSALCSPFNIDIRLALGLQQSASESERYTCTLSTIINNVKNSTVNGASIDGFVNGDFKQGGLPGFIALSQPQNNASGAYIQAQSDLFQKMGARQNTYTQQLNQGRGFLSFESCEDKIVDATGKTSGKDLGISDQDMVELQNTNKLTTASGAKFSVRKDTATGYKVYRTCSFQTPGSVTQDYLSKNLGSGVDELNLADSMNEVLSAMINQLLTQVLTGGLNGASRPQGGETKSLVQKLQKEGVQQAKTAALIAAGGYTSSVRNLEEIQDLYQNAVDAYNTVGNTYLAAESCYISLSTTTNASAANNLSKVQNEYLTKVLPPLSDLSTKLTNVNIWLDNIAAQINYATSTGNTAATTQSVVSFIETQVPNLLKKLEVARDEGPDATKKAKSLLGPAKTLVENCRTMGGIVPAGYNADASISNNTPNQSSSNTNTNTNSQSNTQTNNQQSTNNNNSNTNTGTKTKQQ